MWSRGGTLTLSDGDFNGNVSISTTSDTIYLTLNYPDDVVSVGDTLVCSSTQAGSQNTVTIGAFSKQIIHFASFRNFFYRLSKSKRIS